MTSPFAAFNIADGTVILSSIHLRHRAMLANGTQSHRADLPSSSTRCAPTDTGSSRSVRTCVSFASRSPSHWAWKTLPARRHLASVGPPMMARLRPAGPTASPSTETLRQPRSRERRSTSAYPPIKPSRVAAETCEVQWKTSSLMHSAIWRLAHALADSAAKFDRVRRTPHSEESEGRWLE